MPLFIAQSLLIIILSTLFDINCKKLSSSGAYPGGEGAQGAGAPPSALVSRGQTQ